VQLRDYLLKHKKRSLITVLMYHRVTDETRNVNVVSEGAFQKQMEFLRRYYDVIPVAELLKIIMKKENIGRKVVITFDDGYADNWYNALPVLEAYQLPACCFIPVGFIGVDSSSPRYLNTCGRDAPILTWDQVRDMKGKNIEFGSHTVNHVRLSECDLQIVKEELLGSKSVLEKELNIEDIPFAYPFGS